MPLVAFRRSVRFVEITEAVHAAVLNTPVRAAAARRGDPPPLHRADPARPRGAGDPRRAGRRGRQPGRARGRRARARVLRLRPRGRRRRAVGLGRPAPRRGPRRDPGGRADGRRAADGQLVGPPDRAGGRRAARRLRPRRHRARGAGGGDRPARPAARGAPARALARRVPVRPRRRARGGGRRAPPRRGARNDPAAAGRGVLLPVAASWRGPRSRRGDELSWTRLSGELRAALSSTGFAVLLGPRDVDLLVLLALGARSYDEALAEHVAGLFHSVLERRGGGPGGCGAGDRRAGRHLAGGRPRPAPRAPLGGRRRPRCPRAAGTTRGAPA